MVFRKQCNAFRSYTVLTDHVGGQNKKLFVVVKIVIFSLGYIMTPVTLFRYMNEKKQILHSKAANQLTPGGTLGA